MFIAKRDLNGYTELKALLNDIEWPMIKMGAVSRKYNWVKVFAQLNKVYGVSYILKNFVYLDAKNTSIYSLYVSMFYSKYMNEL